MTEKKVEERNGTGFSNVRWQGKKHIGIPMNQLISEMRTITEGEPHALGRALFIQQGNDGIYFLDKPMDLFGWLEGIIPCLRWNQQPDTPTKAEFFAEVRRQAAKYKAVEVYPHFPPIEGHFYTYKARGVIQGMGHKLKALLDQFNPSTPEDRELILGMMATCLWGGMPGARPAFVITSDDGPGSGKSTLAEACGLLVGGYVDISPNEDIDHIKSRFLTDDPTGAPGPLRVALIDNVKALKFSWADLEGLITKMWISGKKMYYGEGQKPNYYTWIITLNGISLSADLAQRSVVIKVSRAHFSRAFKEQLFKYIQANQWDLICDIAAFFGRKKGELAGYSRWAGWEEDVLRRLANPKALQGLIQARQEESDDDADEADILREAFCQELRIRGFDVNMVYVRIPNAEVGRIYIEATRTGRIGVSVGARRVTGHIHRGKIPELRKDPSRTYGRGVLWVGKDHDGKGHPTQFQPKAVGDILRKYQG